MPETFLQVSTPDGRELEVMLGGDPDGLPWLWHLGSPSGVTAYAPIDEAARDLGLRLISYSRPGYGASTPRWSPGQTFADDVPDMVSVLDHVGADEFVTLGWSGGGPRALAAAALLPERCLAAGTLAGVAPYGAAGLDWFAGMGPENVEEYATAARGPEDYDAWCRAHYTPLFEASADDIATELGGLVPPVDVAALTGDFADFMARMAHHAGSQGVTGARDDGLTLVTGFGFDPADIAVPVAVWAGGEDLMVPFAHGLWLADTVPTARPRLLADEGHLSLLARMPEILTDLRALAGR